MLEIIRPFRLLLALLVLELLLLLLNLFPTPSVTINRLINLDGENNLPVWFTSAQLLLMSVTALSGFRSQKKYAWLILGAIFLALSVDETAMIHESFGAAIYKDWVSPDYVYADWMIVFGALLAIGALLIAWSLFKLYRKHRTAFLAALAGISLWLLVLVFESQGAPHSGTSTLCSPVAMMEEFCEMSGASLFWFAMLTSLNTNSTYSK
ncbi:hypothetical protein IT157_06655 [bacterium]|nr:hypothetical protein [bacterium]